ncbi:uncharacterized protein PV09_01504 [Verruconis gallopava]|uniref:Btz domain-containing protein n=1 Tax=Verruconis gallopava TaxID=253628 RepID=A0A0D2AM65_9PEZI|nr:uncharacterized protein PV09_01504 [Verruconis gallopava]KIW07545.1 hypothetical protein PV09_01504 [Verruconis gallopava]
MPSQNRRRLRRKREEDTEDSEPVVQHIDDSQSENSLPSDDDGDADDSDLSEAERPGSLSPEDQATKANGAVKSHGSEQEGTAVAPKTPAADMGSFAQSEDTLAMMNGLKISDDASHTEALDFEGRPGPAVVTSDVPVRSPSSLRRRENFAELRRRDHEEYKKKRDADPAFIPNRGAFFMHDQRSTQAQNGSRLAGRGRGRGTMVGGPFSPANVRPQDPDATPSSWAHDLHDTLEDPPDARADPPQQQQLSTSTAAAPAVSSSSAPVGQTTVRNYSTTRDLGHVQIRVLLPGMKEAVTYGNTLIRQYTKLPDHRPPLRRDKPVRISLPEKAPRYIFPAVDRSFIFIPRALRPNQQGFGRGRSKLGSMGGYSSRRTSVFGGSVYSPSVAMSRRSSFGRDFRETLVSPAGSVRPVVRMPPGSHHSTAVGTPHAVSGQGTPVMNGPTTYPSGPQKPAYRENWPANMPMHQPRPQKPMSVAGIESPASNFQPPPPPPQQDQPFSHQLPPGVASANGQSAQSGYYPQPQYPTQTAGTPLSNIPERAIHAPAFQPYQQPGFQPGAGYFYPPMQAQYQPGAVIAPMVMQNGQQGGYLVPTIAPGPAGAPQPMQQPPQGQPGVQQFEQNGMVFYYDPSQMYMQPTDGQQYGSYAMPGMGGMMTPAPDGSGFYYPVPNGTVYYPQQ